MTSSSLRMGRDRTLYFFWRSFESVALIIFLRASECAVKWALRAFLREECVAVLNFILPPM